MNEKEEIRPSPPPTIPGNNNDDPFGNADDALKKELEALEINQAMQPKDNTNDNNESDQDGKKKKKKKKEKKKAVSIFKLFRFSTPMDRLMIIIAMIGSAYTGAILPVSILIFGRLIRSVGQSVVDSSDLLDQTHPTILIMVYLGTSVLVAAYFASCFWIITGERQTRKVSDLWIPKILVARRLDC